MSYNVRDDGALLGPGAGVEIPNGVAAPFVTKLQLFEPVTFSGNATNLVTGTKYCAFIAPPNPSNASAQFPMGQYQIAQISQVFNTAGGAGAVVAIEVVAPGTADGSGTNPLSATNITLSSGASATPSNVALSTNVDNLIVPVNGRINFIMGGTLTGLVNLCVVIYLTRLS